MKNLDLLALAAIVGIGGFFLLNNSKKGTESFATRRVLVRRRQVNPASLYLNRNSLIQQYNLPPPPVYNYPQNYNLPPPPPMMSTDAPRTQAEKLAQQQATQQYYDALRTAGIQQSNPEYVQPPRLQGDGFTYTVNPNPIGYTPAEQAALDKSAQMDLERMERHLETAKATTYQPLSPTKVARELERSPISDPKSPHPFVWDVPGFVRGADGFLHWDGHTITEELAQAKQIAESDMPPGGCETLTGEDKASCYTMQESYRQLLEQYRNRPWVPGYDMTEEMIKTTPCYIFSVLQPHPQLAAVHCPPKLSQGSLDIIAMHKKPHPLYTAEEEYAGMLQTMKQNAITREQQKMEDAAYKSYRDRTTPELIPKPGSDYYSPAYQQSLAEDTARKASFENLIDTTNQQALADFQKWFGGYGSGYSMTTSKQARNNAKSYFVGRGSIVDRKRRLG